MSSVTLRSIARSVGVSDRLVAYALNGNGRVGEQTRLRIIEEAKRQGYTPNRAARALVTGQTQLVALCLPHFITGYGDFITHLLEEQVRATDYDLIVSQMSAATDYERLIPTGLRQVDAACLLEPPRLPNAGEMDQVRHVVILGVTESQSLENFDYVRVDLTAASRKAVILMIERKPRRFVFVCAHESTYMPADARLAAYMEGAVRLKQHPIVIEFARKADLMNDAEAAFLRYASQAECPDAVMCNNDEIAIGVLGALRRLGKTVPRDVSIVGCDGIAFTQYTNPPLATISQPLREMVSITWNFMLTRLNNPSHPPQHAVLEAEFIARESVLP